MYIDFHCDTLYHMSVRDANDDLYDNKEVSVDLKRMKEAGQIAQFFAIFMDTKEKMESENIPFPSDEEYIEGRLFCIRENLKKYSDISALALNFFDIEKNKSDDKISVFLTLEEGRVLDNSMDNLEYYYKEGIRLITLTWNYENSLGFPNSFDPVIMNKGLKNFGKDVVERMAELGMLIDVSHLSDGGFWDVANILKTPFIASHSNARELDSHPRNLTDEMIREVSNHGGVIGLNFAPAFLNQSQIPKAQRNWSGFGEKKIVVHSRIDDMIRHLKHILNVGGEDVIALGSDLDGIGGELEISSPLDFQKLFDRMAREGFNERQIEKFKYQNAKRIIKEVLK